MTELATDIRMSVSTATEAVSSLPCAICRRQFARYTCPQCNIPYCSLTCFRSETHPGCSETFYRKELETDIRGGPSRSAEERQQMLGVLAQFEAGQMDALPAEFLPDERGESDGESEGGELAQRLDGVDLDSATYEEVWARLTPGERARFLRALEEPGSALAQQLVAAAAGGQMVAPWWEATGVGSAGSTPAQSPLLRPLSSPLVPARSLQGEARYGEAPEMMEVPVAMVRAAEASVGSAPILLYNMCALCLAYAYVTRTLATSPLSAIPPSSPDHHDARTTLARLVPFLADRRSTIIHPTLESVVTDFAARFEPGVMSPRFLSLLLRDAEQLLRPAPISLLRHISLPAGAPPFSPTHSPALRPTHLSPIHSPVLRAARSNGSMHSDGDEGTLDLTAHPARRAILALSDLLALFGAAARPPCPPSRSHPYAAPAPGLPDVLAMHGRSHSLPDIPRAQSAEPASGRSPDGMPPMPLHAGPHAGKTRKGTYVTHKLTFYAAHTLGAPTAMLRVLADEVSVRAAQLAREADMDAERAQGALNGHRNGNGNGNGMAGYGYTASEEGRGRRMVEELA